MSFGAMAAWQAGLLLVAAAGGAAWLFLIRLRPPRVPVPSLLLWRRVLDQPRETTLWERIRRVVSLVATIAIAGLLALAVTRPGRGVSAGSGGTGRLLVVVDSSWSMLARTRSGETRWDRAIAEARRLATAASGDQVALATTADGLVEAPTADLTLIESDLDRLTPSGGEGTGWPRVAGVDAVHFITDGAVPRSLDADVVVHSVFEPAPNVAITALAVRPSLSGASAGDAFLEVANFAPSAQRVHVTMARGSASILDRQIDMAAGEAIHQALPLARGGDARLHAHVDAPGDALAADDDAVAWIEHSQPLSIAVVGSDTSWLASLLGRDADVRATLVAPAKYRSGPEDAVVFDRWAPAVSPSRPALCLAPPATAWLGATGPEESHPRWVTAGSHPVVRGVDPLTLTIDKARPYGAPALQPVARSERDTPLVYVSQSVDQRLVVVTFGPDESNLARAPGFPVLIGDALDWLTRPAEGGSRRPGPASFDRSVSRLTGPDGSAVPLEHAGDRLTTVLARPGLYVAEGGGARSSFAVNVGDPQVSNLLRTSLGASGRALAVTSGASGRAWWLYCVAAAFALIFAEWWTWQRRITV
jgi:hypothetical protein